MRILYPSLIPLVARFGKLNVARFLSKHRGIIKVPVNEALEFSVRWSIRAAIEQLALSTNAQKESSVNIRGTVQLAVL